MPLIWILLGASALVYFMSKGGAGGYTSAQLDQIFATAMSPSMTSINELTWAMTQLKTGGHTTQADTVNVKIQGLAAAGAVATAAGNIVNPPTTT